MKIDIIEYYIYRIHKNDKQDLERILQDIDNPFTQFKDKEGSYKELIILLREIFILKSPYTDLTILFQEMLNNNNNNNNS